MNLIKSAARQVVPALGVLCGLASAQVWNGGGTIVPAATPKYYQATDLGQVAEQFPIGCLSRGGLVAVTRHGFELGVGAWTTRALLPYSGTPFWRPPGTSSWARACNDQMEVVGQIVGRGNVLWDGTMAQPQWVSGDLQAINNRRQVVGSAPDGSGQPRAVVWHTNPQPGDPTQVWMAPGTATGIMSNSSITRRNTRHCSSSPRCTTSGSRTTRAASGLGASRRTASSSTSSSMSRVSAPSRSASSRSSTR